GRAPDASVDPEPLDERVRLLARTRQGRKAVHHVPGGGVPRLVVHLEAAPAPRQRGRDARHPLAGVRERAARDRRRRRLVVALAAQPPLLGAGGEKLALQLRRGADELEELRAPCDLDRHLGVAERGARVLEEAAAVLADAPLWLARRHLLERRGRG